LDTILEKIKKEEQKNFRNSFTSLSALTTAFTLWLFLVQKNEMKGVGEGSMFVAVGLLN
jgi:hypothetical protein